MNCRRSRMSTFLNSLKKSTFLDTPEKSTFLDSKSLLFRIWPNIESLLFWTPKSRLFWTVLECRIPKVYFFGCNRSVIIPQMVASHHSLISETHKPNVWIWTPSNTFLHKKWTSLVRVTSKKVDFWISTF